MLGASLNGTACRVNWSRMRASWSMRTVIPRGAGAVYPRAGMDPTRRRLAARAALVALAPGTRVVSYVHDMDDWKPDRVRTVGKKAIHAWTVPERRPPEVGPGR